MGWDGSTPGCFIAYQRDPREEFVPIQRELTRTDRLDEDIRHVSSGLFACPSGIRDETGYWARLYSTNHSSWSCAIIRWSGSSAWVIPHPVNDGATMRRVIDLGEDGPITDDPDLLVTMAIRNGLR
jgi:hypothetical protein